MPSSRKRKHVAYRKSSWAAEDTGTVDSVVEPANAALFIQAHEADIVRGPQASVARSMEIVASGGRPGLEVGDGLVRWGGGGVGARKGKGRDMGIVVHDEDDEWDEEDEDVRDVWIDRYGMFFFYYNYHLRMTRKTAIINYRRFFSSLSHTHSPNLLFLLFWSDTMRVSSSSTSQADQHLTLIPEAHQRVGGLTSHLMRRTLFSSHRVRRRITVGTSGGGLYAVIGKNV
jgi:hypothetical protein